MTLLESTEDQPLAKPEPAQNRKPSTMREFLLVLLGTCCALTAVSGQLSCPVDSNVKDFFWTKNERCCRAEIFVVDKDTDDDVS